MQNKRGQGLEVSTLILIVLGVIILVLLVLGFSMGWGNLWEKVNIFQGGSSIESVIQGCKVAVSSASTYSYCNDFKKITVNGKIEYVNCEDARVIGSLGGSTLSCTDSAKIIEEQCIKLANAAPVSKTYNPAKGINVSTIHDCTNIASVNGQPCNVILSGNLSLCY
jgi:hypothetical protein